MQGSGDEGQDAPFFTSTSGPVRQDGATVGQEARPGLSAQREVAVGGGLPAVGRLIPPAVMLRFAKMADIAVEGERGPLKFGVGLRGARGNGAVSPTGVLVVSAQTGQQYDLTWPEIVAMALMFGIDELAAPPGAVVPPPAKPTRSRLILPGG